MRVLALGVLAGETAKNKLQVPSTRSGEALRLAALGMTLFRVSGKWLGGLLLFEGEGEFFPLGEE